MKKILIWMIVLILIPSFIIMSIGCKKETTPTVEEETAEEAVEEEIEEKAEASPEKIILNVDNDGELQWDPATVWQKEQFEAMNPNIEINLIVTTYDEHQATLTRMATGAQEPYDVWQMTDQWVPGLVQTDIFLSLDNIFPADKIALYADWQQKAMKNSAGNIILCPVFGVIPVFMYNTELFEEAGFQDPPKTWDELVLYATGLNNSDENIWGFVDVEDSLNKFWHWLFQAGGIPFEDDWTAAFNSDEGVTALQFLIDLRNKHQVVPPGAVNWMTEDEQMLFLSGNAAMSLSWAYGIDRAANSEESMVKDGFSVSMFPEGPGKTSATSYEDNYYGIPKTIDESKLDAAFKWLDYISSFEAQVGMLVNEPGNYVPIPSAYDVPEVMESVPFANILKEQVLNAKNTLHPFQGEVSDILLSEIQAALLGEKTAKEALDDAASKINELIE